MTGKGVRATIDGNDVLVGKPGWLDEEGIDLSIAREEIERLQGKGLTTVVVAGDLIGRVGIGDEIKPDATETINRMKDIDIIPVMITGDSERTARAVAELNPEQLGALSYTFDMGDGWEHYIELRETHEGSLDGDPVVVDEQGAAPSQYPGLDDEQ